MIATKPPRRRNNFDSVTWCLGGVLLLTAIVFLRSLENGFVFDDLDQIVHNRYLGEWSFIWKSMVNNALWFRDPNRPPALSYYRPFQNVWFALNFHLFGLNAAGWHTAQAALHLIVVWLVFRVAARLTDNRRVGLLAAALFAVMPLRAEPVVCIFAIGTPMSAAFELAAFDYYLRRFPSPASFAGAGSHRRDRTAGGIRAKFAYPSTGRADEGAGNSAALAISLSLFGLALLSHDCAIVFPALVAAHAFLLEPHRPPGSYRTYALRARAAIAAAWPYLIEAAAYLCLRLWVLGFLSEPNPSNPPMTAIQRVLTIPAALWAYLKLLAMPWRAGPAHPLAAVSSVASQHFYLPAAGIVTLCAAAFFLLRNNAHRGLYLFCAAWFLITLAPILDLDVLFFQAAIQDRYLYLPSIGVCVFAADLVLSGFPLHLWRGVRGGVATAAVLVLAAMLFHAEAYWHDQAAMFTQ
ncbi:MAG: hypothetical protein ACREQI_17205, partial [Candidatus Binataceae bacterium]